MAQSGELAVRIRKAQKQLSACRLCPHACNVNRLRGEIGVCLATDRVRVYKYKQHFGEEPPISGIRGSGIIFFSGCTLRCVFCQNYPFSHWRRGHDISPVTLAKMFLLLQKLGVHNLNWVTPTHYLPQALEALGIAAEQGLRLPLVYNTNAFESREALELLDGLVDVYLPDFKYAFPEPARRYSKAKTYPRFAQAAIREMFRQVGFLQVDATGMAQKGLIVRHLVLPNQLENTFEVLRFLAEDISPHIHLSLMTQYLPIWGAKRYAEINRRITRTEYQIVSDWVEKFGFTNGWLQEWDA